MEIYVQELVGLIIFTCSYFLLNTSLIYSFIKIVCNSIERIGEGGRKEEGRDGRWCETKASRNLGKEGD